MADERKSSKRPRASGPGAGLRFFPSRGPEGFSSGEAAHSRHPYAAVRELVQNSLDAGINAGRTAIIRFAVENAAMGDIPDIGEFRRAFDSACEWMKESNRLAGNNAQIAKMVGQELQREEVPVLFVTDNGVGLNSETMVNLLGNGASAKGKNETGSFGVGHFAVFALSKLNYLLYGGLHKGRMIAAGHALLASHYGADKKPRDKNGYYVMGLRHDNLDAPFVFPQDGGVPPFLGDKLNALPGESESGSVVAVPGFNYLTRNPGEMVERIETIAADNFFPAIDSERLVVEIVTLDGAKSSVDSRSLASIVERGRGQKRWRGVGNYPSSQRVAESYETLKKGERLEMPLKGGRVDIFLRQDVQRPNIAICRKGMWITDSYRPICGPAHYSDKVQFDALLLVEPLAGEMHDIIKDAEGPWHNALAPRSEMEGDAEGRKKLAEFAKDVQNFLKGWVKDLDSDPYVIKGFIDVESGKSIGESLRGAYFGRGVAVTSVRKSGQSQNTEDVPPPPPLPNEKPAKPLPGLKVANYWQPGSKTVLLSVEVERECEDAELWLGIDGGSDDTCSGLPWEDLSLRKVTMNGRKLPLLKRGGKTVGANLGDLPGKTPVQIDFEFEGGNAPEQLAILCHFCQRVRPESGGMPDASA